MKKNNDDLGIIIEIIGTIVTVKFPEDKLPKINDALII
ncbi:MAG: hypothetical protein LBB39_03045, partial [Mycoplasmataceae bacterium]|nr:hypothetical protein [Mycoplasmataceae bacterium]